MAKKQEHTASLVDTQLERALLVALMTDIYATEHVRSLVGMIQPEDFTQQEFCDVWKVMAKCYDQGKEISPINIFATGKAMGIDVDLRRYTSRDSIYADAES